jgi:hypothetical protein
MMEELGKREGYRYDLGTSRRDLGVRWRGSGDLEVKSGTRFCLERVWHKKVDACFSIFM